MIKEYYNKHISNLFLIILILGAIIWASMLFIPESIRVNTFTIGGMILSLIYETKSNISK